MLFDCVIGGNNMIKKIFIGYILKGIIKFKLDL